MVQTYLKGLLSSSEIFDANDLSVQKSTYTYDPFDRLLTVTDSRTGTVTYDVNNDGLGDYTDAGQVLAVRDAAGFETSMTYDKLGRTIITDAPDTVDKDGNTLDNIVYSAYYLDGQLKAQWGATNPSFYEYDDQNRMTKLHTYKTVPPTFGTDPLLVSDESFALPTGSAVTTWNYNSQRGWLDSKVYDDDKGTDYTYTSAGRLASRVWERGVTTDYVYDEGQLIETLYSDDTPEVFCEYDEFGRKTSCEQRVNGVATNRCEYTYDATNLLLTEETISYGLDTATPFERTLLHDYDTILRKSNYQLTPDDTVLDATGIYTYDRAGRLATVADANDTHTYAYLANSYGLLESVTSPAHKVTNTYELNRNVLTNKANTSLDGTTIFSNYAYNVNGIGQRDQRTMSAVSYTHLTLPTTSRV